MARNGRGYLLVEQQAVNADITPVRLEMATMTCVHCNRIVVLNPQRTRPRNWCIRCDAYVCDQQFCITECNPFQQSLDLSLEHFRKGDPFLLRGPRGEVLYERTLERKVY